MATAGDISWQGPQGTFNLQVAAILTSGGEILLCTIEGLGHSYLPGGRVHRRLPHIYQRWRGLAVASARRSFTAVTSVATQFVGDAEPGEGGERAQRHVPDDGEQFLAAEDAGRPAVRAGAQGVAQRLPARRVAEPFGQRRGARQRERGRGGLDRDVLPTSRMSREEAPTPMRNSPRSSTHRRCTADQ